MNLIDRATIIHFHRHRIATYASGTVKALGWKGAESQIRRFEVLAGVDDLSGCSVLDLGCGYGDLKPFLDQGFTGVAYIGVDQMHEFVREAAKRHGRCRNTRFFLGDFTTMALPRVDYVLASGAFGYLTVGASYPTISGWKSYLKNTSFPAARSPTWCATARSKPYRRTGILSPTRIF